MAKSGKKRNNEMENRKNEGKEREKEERNGSTIQSCTRPFVSFFISLTEKAVVSEEFVAHGALVNVNCLRIESHSVIVTDWHSVIGSRM